MKERGHASREGPAGTRAQLCHVPGGEEAPSVAVGPYTNTTGQGAGQVLRKAQFILHSHL